MSKYKIETERATLAMRRELKTMMKVREKIIDKGYLVTPSRNHVVKLKKWVETQQKVYLVMDLCNGPTLEEYVHIVWQNRKMDETEVWAIYRQMLSAFGVLDMHGVIHRDLKLDNFLLHFPHINSEQKH